MPGRGGGRIPGGRNWGIPAGIGGIPGIPGVGSICAVPGPPTPLTGPASPAGAADAPGTPAGVRPRPAARPAPEAHFKIKIHTHSALHHLYHIQAAYLEFH